MRTILTFKKVFRVKIDILKLFNECTKYKIVRIKFRVGITPSKE